MIKKKILIVDDDYENADLLALLLQRHGADVCVKYGGRQALEALQSFHPDIAIIDIGMNDMDGYETAQCIRKISYCENIQLIALTGFGSKEDKKQIMEANFNMHLIKPISIDAIQMILDL